MKLDSTGNCVAEYSYDAWGNCTIDSDKNGIAEINPLRYRGYYFDSDTGLYYLQSRYYDSNIGRFLSSDSIEILKENANTFNEDCIASFNLFSYCDNNPTSYIDYNGKKKKKKNYKRKKYHYFVVYYKDASSNFVEQAKYMSKEKYKDKNVYFVYFKTKAEFKSIWERIGNYAKDIHLFLHGNADELCFSDCDMPGSELYYWSYKVMTGKLYLYTCDGGTSASNGWSIAARFAKLIKGKKVRAVVDGSMYYRGWGQIFERWPLTKEKDAYWADFYLRYGKRGKPDAIYRKKVGGKGKMPKN